MEWGLFDEVGRRKYLTRAERLRFIRIAAEDRSATGLFCVTIAVTGARVSEVLALTRERLDRDNGAIVFETLKRRTRGAYRSVPVPFSLLAALAELSVADNEGGRIWPWCRTTAWTKVKQVALRAGIAEQLAIPRALRHAFGVAAVQDRIALNLVGKWLGHTKVETTAIYANAIGPEERNLASLTWKGFPSRFAGAR